MATATITLKDDGAGQVDITLDFGDAGTDNDSQAHHMAVAMLRSQTGRLSDDDEEGAGHD